MHKYLMEAADEIQVKGVRLAQRLYVPEPFSEARKAQLAQRRGDRLALLRSPEDDGRFKMALLLGEFKGSQPCESGRKVWIRHMPDCPLFIEARAWARIEKRFAALFEARDGNPSLRLVMGALIYAEREYTYQIDTASLMLATQNWIPIEDVHEVELIRHLTDAERRFIKPLRYDAATAAVFPNVLLVDTGAVPMPLHVVSPLMAVKESAAKEKAICAGGPNQWVWHTDRAIPPLPPVVTHGYP